ncbi:MFS transporter [Pandoraea oxalativorans]|uniref:MFS transporter n=1 Tax=Pandoraea oxalativorans TaxID=573737 RepID=UPI00316ADF8F
MLAGPISGMIGGPLSTWVMANFSGVCGRGGWQWMFIVEGLPCMFLGMLAFVLLDNRPADARRLCANEQQLLLDALDASGRHHSFRQVIKRPHVYWMAAPYFCLICGIYAVSFWPHSNLKASGVTDATRIGIFSAIPYVASAVTMVVVGRRSDRREERRNARVGNGIRRHANALADLHEGRHGNDVGSLHRLLDTAARVSERRRGRGRHRTDRYPWAAWWTREPDDHRRDAIRDRQSSCKAPPDRRATRSRRHHTDPHSAGAHCRCMTPLATNS